MNHWLVKSEPEAYSWADFVRDGGTDWTGVHEGYAYHRLFVHAAAAPDATAEAGSPWVAVHLRPHAPLARPVPLAALKAEPRLAQLGLLRQSRLSVTPVRAEEFDLILALAEG
jgi:predicted RNA-binding protein with PUA-like domain